MQFSGSVGEATPPHQKNVNPVYMAKSVKLRHRRRSHAKTHKRAPKKEANRAVRKTRRVQRKAHHKRRSNEAKKTRKAAARPKAVARPKAAARPKATARPKAVAKRRKTVGRRRRTRGGSVKYNRLSPAVYQSLKNDVQIGKDGSTIVVTPKSDQRTVRDVVKGAEGVAGYYTAGSLAYGTSKAAPAVSRGAKAVARAIRDAFGQKPTGPRMVSEANNDTMSYKDILGVQSSMDKARVNPVQQPLSKPTESQVDGADRAQVREQETLDPEQSSPWEAGPAPGEQGEVLGDTGDLYNFIMENPDLVNRADARGETNELLRDPKAYQDKIAAEKASLESASGEGDGVRPSSYTSLKDAGYEAPPGFLQRIGNVFRGKSSGKPSLVSEVRTENRAVRQAERNITEEVDSDGNPVENLDDGGFD